MLKEKPNKHFVDGIRSIVKIFFLVHMGIYTGTYWLWGWPASAGGSNVTEVNEWNKIIANYTWNKWIKQKLTGSYENQLPKFNMKDVCQCPVTLLSWNQSEFNWGSFRRSKKDSSCQKVWKDLLKPQDVTV